MARGLLARRAMNTFVASLTAVSVLAAVLAPGSAHAEPPGPSIPAPAPPASTDRAPSAAPARAGGHRRVETRLTLDSGVFSDDHGGGVALGGELLHRRGWLALAAAGEYGTTVFSPYEYGGASAGAGLSLPTPSWMRLDVLGTFGAHYYDGVGGASGLFAVFGPIDQGVDATLPSAGARVSATFELGGPMRFVIGVKGLVDRDLTQATKRHERTYVFSAPETLTTTIGGTRLVGLLTLGMAVGH